MEGRRSSALLPRDSTGAAMRGTDRSASRDARLELEKLLLPEVPAGVGDREREPDADRGVEQHAEQPRARQLREQVDRDPRVQERSQDLVPDVEAVAVRPERAETGMRERADQPALARAGQHEDEQASEERGEQGVDDRRGPPQPRMRMAHQAERDRAVPGGPAARRARDPRPPG